jgi:hypothetical protein
MIGPEYLLGTARYWKRNCYFKRVSLLEKNNSHNQHRKGNNKMRYPVEKAKLYYPQNDIKSHPEWVPADPKQNTLYFIYDDETDTISKEAQ